MCINNNNNWNFNPNNMNPALLTAFQNMYNMNPNFNMMNQMQLNQMLMNFIAMNPQLMMNNNNINNNIMPNNMTNFQSFASGNNNMGTGVKGGNLPRRQFPDVDSYPWYKGPRINVVFEISTGPKINIAAPPTETVEGILFKFCERVGVSPNLLKKELICVYNATYINAFNKDTIQNFFKQNYGFNNLQAKIIVIDAQNIIGA